MALLPATETRRSEHWTNQTCLVGPPPFQWTHRSELNMPQNSKHTGSGYGGCTLMSSGVRSLVNRKHQEARSLDVRGSPNRWQFSQPRFPVEIFSVSQHPQIPAKAWWWFLDSQQVGDGGKVVMMVVVECRVRREFNEAIPSAHLTSKGHQMLLHVGLASKHARNRGTQLRGQKQQKYKALLLLPWCLLKALSGYPNSDHAPSPHCEAWDSSGH